MRIRMWIRLLGSVVGAAALVVAASPRAPVAAQSPSLSCDTPFPAGGRAAAASRHNCWMPESGGQSAVPWPASGSFAEGSVVTVYSRRWDAAGAPRLFCSAQSSRGADYDRWFTAAAVRGGSTVESASLGVRAGSVPAGDRIVSAFVGGRPSPVLWQRGSRYDARSRRWVSSAWQPRGSAGPAAVEEGEPVVGRRPPPRPGYTCPEFGLMPSRLGDWVDGAVAGADATARCVGSPVAGGELSTGDDSSGVGLGGGPRIADAPLVAAFSSGLACVERESVVLTRYLRERWVDESYTEYDPGCDLSGAGLGPGQSAAGLRPGYCDGEGFDLGGGRLVESGYWEQWWDYRWEANPAETDAHLPWARVFWHDGGGRAGFESGGVLVGDDGTAACLVDRGFVRSPALPGVVPSVASGLEGGWTDYGSGTVSVRCPKEDGSAGFTSPPAGSPAPGFDAVVSVDFPPAIHEAAAAESYALARYESSRPCSRWPADADPAPVSGVDCDAELGVSAARRARLSSFERQVATSAAAGRISSFFVDDAARMMTHSWDLHRAGGLAGRLELDTPWDGGADVGAGVAAEARRFGPPVSSWADCGRRDYLMGSGADSLWGAWVARARTHAAAEAAGSAELLGLAAGFDGRTSVSCTAGGDCRPVPEAFVARHAAIEAEARRLGEERAASPARVCGIGDRVSPPGP